MAAGTPNGPAGTAGLVFSAMIVALSGSGATYLSFESRNVRCNERSASCLAAIPFAYCNQPLWKFPPPSLSFGISKTTAVSLAATDAPCLLLELIVAIDSNYVECFVT